MRKTFEVTLEQGLFRSATVRVELDTEGDESPEYLQDWAVDLAYNRTEPGDWYEKIYETNNSAEEIK